MMNKYKIMLILDLNPNLNDKLKDVADVDKAVILNYLTDQINQNNKHVITNDDEFITTKKALNKLKESFSKADKDIEDWAKKYMKKNE